MNIFATFPCPILSANFLDDKRMIKMILESAQLLCGALREQGETSVAGIELYKSTHINHPCAKWTRRSQANYMWLWKHAMQLCENYRKIYHKTHKCERLIRFLYDGYKLLPEIDQTQFPNCTTVDDPDVNYCYRMYLREKWAADKRPPTRAGQRMEFEYD